MMYVSDTNELITVNAASKIAIAIIFSERISNKYNPVGTAMAAKNNTSTDTSFNTLLCSILDAIICYVIPVPSVPLVSLLH